MPRVSSRHRRVNAAPAWRLPGATTTHVRAPPNASACWHSVVPGGKLGGMGKAAIDLTALTAEQKLELIDELWVSLQADGFDLTDEQRAELDRRLERLELEGPTGHSWESVRAEMTSK